MLVDPKSEPLMDNAELAKQLEKRPSPNHLTPTLLKDKIATREFHKLTSTLTVCVLTMDNGFTVVGKSACADPANYDQAIGEKIAFEDAFNQLWPLEGYLLRQRLFLEGKDWR